MKTLLTVLLVAAGITLEAGEPTPDLVWGPGGYANALSRLEAKGNAAEQREALAELKWLQANQAHINKLLEFVNAWWENKTLKR